MEQNIARIEVNVPTIEDVTVKEKPLFQCIWSTNNEITFLKEMTEYGEVEGVDFSNDINRFYKFIRECLSIDAIVDQAVNKIKNCKMIFFHYELRAKHEKD